MIAFHLTPRGPVYVGSHVSIEREITLEHVPSDTLFSALALAWAAQGALEARLPACLDDRPAVRLTSAFPRAGDIRFYPAPLGLKENTGTDGLSPKTRKRVRWVSEGVFQKLRAFGDLRTEIDAAANFAQNGAVWMLKDELTAARRLLGPSGEEPFLYRIQLAPRVSLDRAAGASNYFETARLVFAEGCGLWLAAQGLKPEHETWVEEGLTRLQDTGLGGLRSIGHGAFTLAKIPAPAALKLAAPANGMAVLLSRYSPREDELDAALRAPGSAYGLETAGGWCVDDGGKPWRRKPVRLVREGSIVGAGAVGRIQNVAPEAVMSRPVYRSGLAFAVPVDAKAVAS